MSNLEFGYNKDNHREFLPEYGGVNWQEAWEHAHPDVEQLSVWGEANDELGEFCEQLNQTNCVFYFNDTNPDFNCVVVLDYRDDGGDWWFSQQQIGEEMFNDLYDRFSDEVMVVSTKYPAQQVAEYVMRILFNDLDKS